MKPSLVILWTALHKAARAPVGMGSLFEEPAAVVPASYHLRQPHEMTRAQYLHHAQQKMIALHHLDCPWRPDMLEQREGRIIRKGNENPKVQIFTYGTKGEEGALSMDAFMWQTVEGKARAIAQVKHGDPATRTVEDVDDMVLTAGQMKALTSGNPLLKEMVDLDNQYRQLSGRARQHERAQWSAKADLEALPGRIAQTKSAIADLQAHVAYRQEHKPEKFGMTIGGKAFDNADQAGLEVLRLGKASSSPQPTPIGDYAGFEVAVAKDPMYDDPLVYLSRPGVPGHIATASLANAESGKGIIGRLSGALDRLGKGLEDKQKKLETDERDYQSLQGSLKPFPQLEQLRAIERRLGEVKAKLKPNEDAKVDAPASESDSTTLTKAIILIKGIYYNRATGETRGQASYLSQAPNVSLAHSDRLAPMVGAMGGVRGLTHAGTTYRAQRTLGSSGAAGLAHQYTHNFTAVRPGRAAGRLMRNLSANYHVIGHQVHYGTDANGYRQEKHTFSAVSKDFQGTHHFTVTQSPDLLQRGMMAADRVGPIAASLGGAVARGALRGVRMAAGAIRSRGPVTENPAETAPLHALASAFKAAHSATTTQRARRNALGMPASNAYSHVYNHRQPQVTARRMASALQGKGHQVSEISQRRVYLNDGSMRHQYSFHATHPSGGPTHTVHIYRA